MNWIDQLATRLQPFRKRLVIGTFVSFFLCVVFPIVTGAVVGPTFPKAASGSVIIPMSGMTTCWGLFLIAYWYAPGKGPMSLEVLGRKHWILALYGRFFRLFSPVVLLVWFLAPVIAVVMMLL